MNRREFIKAAGVAKYIELERRDFAEIEEIPANGYLITNPPYDQRLRLEDAEAFYGMIGSKLKHVFRGYHAWIIAYDNDQFDRIGLRPSVHYPLLNGALDCELREYVIFDGTYDEIINRWTRADDASTLEVPQQRGNGRTIRVASFPSQPPLNFISNGKPSGIEPDLLTEWANRRGWKLEYLLMDFASQIPAIQTGKADLSVGYISITEEHKKLLAGQCQQIVEEPTERGFRIKLII